jgi:hypothetical protein
MTLLMALLVVFLAHPLITSATTLSRTGVFVWRHGDDQQGRPVDRYFLQSGDEELLIAVSDVLPVRLTGVWCKSRLMHYRLAVVMAGLTSYH